MKYLFWNTNKNVDINPILCDLIAENDISMIVLAEYVADIDELVDSLRERGILMKVAKVMDCERLQFLGVKRLKVKPLLDLTFATIKLVNDSIILCCVHLKSQIYSDHENKREIRIRKLIRDVIECEKENGMHNTIITGDFNINPYDDSCIGVQGFHALHVYEETERKSRTVSEEEFFMFYNPMWNFLGDFNKPYGTHYYNSGDTVNTYWNIYDQVIIRPELRKNFVNESLKILTTVGQKSLLDEKGHPNTKFSDHLPLTFEITEFQND